MTNQTRPIRWGILGAAKFAREHMGPAIHAAAGAELAVVGSRSLEKTAPFQAFAPGCRAADSYDAVLNDPDIDAIYIPLPHTMHAEYVVRALDAGKHVLAEKPIAMNVGEFDAMIAARNASGLLAAEGYMIAHHPQWARLKHLIADGAIGDVHHVTGIFTYNNSADMQNIRNKPDMGGGALRDIGVYALGAAQMAMGLPLSDIAAQIRWEDGFDALAHVQARLGSATYAGMVSTRMHLHQEMSFHGTKGLIKMPAPFNPRVFGEGRIELYQDNHGLRVERFPTAEQYKLQVERFCAAIDTPETYPWQLEDARQTQIAIDTVLQVATSL